MKEQINWEVEMEKCKNSFYYFFTNYYLVDGKKPVVKHSEEEFNRLFSEACKGDKK